MKSLMRFGGFLLAFLLLFGGALRVLRAANLLTGPEANDPTTRALSLIRPGGIRANMGFLADDLLEGRGVGSRGHEIAARFIAAQFEAEGLEPASIG